MRPDEGAEIITKIIIILSFRLEKFRGSLHCSALANTLALILGIYNSL